LSLGRRLRACVRASAAVAGMVVGDAANGWPAEKLFGVGAANGLTFDDVVFLPSLEAAPKPAGPAKFSSRFSKNIILKTPIVAGPGRTICEEQMAVQAALLGGIGIIHGDQSIEDQIAMIRRVKEFETAFILSPAVIGPRATVREAEKTMREAGCSSVLITDNGRVGSKLAGLITRRDLDSLSDSDKFEAVTKHMVIDVVTASEPVTFREAQAIMQKHKVGKLPVINSERELVALICRGDQRRVDEHPNATRDPNTQLIVGAAVSMGQDQAGFERAVALVEAGADAIVVLMDEGVSEATVDFVKRLKATFLTTDIVCARVSSMEMADALCKADCDGIMVGAPVGPRDAGGAGIADATCLFQVARLARMNYGIPVCAEGGVHSAGHAVKAALLGASTFAPRELLSRTAESPGEHVYQNGVRVKLRPVADRRPTAGSTPVMLGCQSVVDCGSLEELVEYLLQRVQAGFAALGLKGHADVHPSLASGALRLEVQRPCLPQDRGPPDQLERRRLVGSALFNRW